MNLYLTVNVISLRLGFRRNFLSVSPKFLRNHNLNEITVNGHINLYLEPEFSVIAIDIIAIGAGASNILDSHFI